MTDVMMRGAPSAVRSGVRVEPATAGAARAVVLSSSEGSLARRFWCARGISAPEALARYGRFLMPAEPGRPAWVVRYDGCPVGLLNLVVLAEHTAEAAVLVAARWQGQGVATRLVSAVFCSGDWTGWAVGGLVQPDNAPARRLLDRVGPARSRLVGVGPGELEFVVDIRVEEDGDDGGGTGRRVL